MMSGRPDPAKSEGPLVWRGLAPKVDVNDVFLILGSFPGHRSLQVQAYYGHPQNQFWRLLGAVFDLPLASAGYAARLTLLRRAGIGLWDVITETERDGSLDSAIRNPRASDLHGLLDTLPALRVIGFNGGTAARLGRRELGSRVSSYRVVDLPSSSAAYTLAFEAKLACWRSLREPQET